MTCAECTSRGYVYRADCQSCQARMIARTPDPIAAQWLQSWGNGKDSDEIQSMRDMIEHERILG